MHIHQNKYNSSSAIYELLGDATHPSFKACLELVKGIRA
jgi:hypothetical protein